MTVKELIERLQKFNPETTVILEYEKGIGWFDVSVVEEILPNEDSDSTFINIGQAY